MPPILQSDVKMNTTAVKGALDPHIDAEARRAYGQATATSSPSPVAFTGLVRKW